MSQIYATREEWLQAAVDEFSGTFRELGSRLPKKIRVTCGFTSGGTRKTKKNKIMIGECWDSERSGDKTTEIMVSPIEDTPTRVLAILAHELCHAANGVQNGHHAAFPALARGLKLEGPLTMTFGGVDFANEHAHILKTLGDYPHAKLDTASKVKQGTRMIKCVCPDCGYTVRTTEKWLLIGMPHCDVKSHAPMERK